MNTIIPMKTLQTHFLKNKKKNQKISALKYMFVPLKHHLFK